MFNYFLFIHSHYFLALRNKTSKHINKSSYSFIDNFQLPIDDVNGARQIYGRRTSALPPLVLEQCGGKLNEKNKFDTICDIDHVDAMLILGNEIFVFKVGIFFPI